MDPPLSPPPPLSQNLSSLLSQLQGSASSTPPPPSLVPAPPSSVHSPSDSIGGRTIDDLFRTIRGPGVPLPTSPTHSAMSQEDEQAKRRGLLTIFNTQSPASPPPPPPSNSNFYAGSAPSSYIAAQTGPPSAGGVNGSGSIPGGGGGGGGKSLLDLLMGGGPSTSSSSPYSQAPPPAHLRSEPSFSPPPQESMNPLVPSSPPPPSHPQQDDDHHAGSTPDYRPSEHPIPLASMASPSPPSSHQELIAIAVLQESAPAPAPILASPPTSPSPPKVPTPSLFSFVSDFDAFSPPSSKRSKSVVPPGSGGVTTLPLTRSVSSTVGPPPAAPRRSEPPAQEELVVDGIPPSFGQLPSFLSSTTETVVQHPVPGLPKLFPDLFPASQSLPLSSPPTSSHSPFSQEEQQTRTPLSSSMSNLVSLAEGTATTSSTIEPPPSSSSPNKKQPPKPQFGHTRTSSGSLRASRGETVVPSGPYRAKGFVEVERKHRRSSSWQSIRAPFLLEGKETRIDVSSPNLESLVQSDVIQKKPITIIKGDLCFGKGRTVGSSRTGAIAYCMNKGRVRLIDETTGARALLKLPLEWFARDAQVANLELEGTRIACITTDGGLIVWSFPPTWSEDNPECQIIYAVLPPSSPASRFNLVKWQSSSTLGVSSGSSIVLLDLPTVSQAWLETSPSSPATPDFLFDGENTRRISFSPDPIVGFGFVNSSRDGSGRGFGVVVLSASTSGVEGEEERATLATLMVTDEGESTYSVVEELAVGTKASSVMFVDERNVVVGSEKDTVAQLFKLEQEEGREMRQHGFSLRGTIRLEKPEGGPGMFSKMEWDPKRELLWISNTARSSLLAFRLQLHPTSPTSPPFTQLAEFPVDQAMSSFHISIFSNDFEIYSVSPHGIDQITMSDASLRDIFVSPASTPAAAATEVEQVKVVDQEEEESFAAATLIIKTEEVQISLDGPSSPVTNGGVGGGTSSTSASNIATPTVGRSQRRAKAAAAAAAAGIPPPEDSFGRSQVASSSSSAPAEGGGVSSGLLAEIKKVEENIKTKVSALLEKQSNRLEANDLQRQETVFKLIANELKANTTKVLTSSIQTEMRASVLPALLEVTREEIQALVQAEISKGLKEAMISSLPSELERHLNSRGFASVVFPSIDKAIKDLIHKTLVPAYNDATSELYDALSREIRADMVAIRKEVVSEQSNALIETHSLVQDMSKTILALGTQVVDLQKMVSNLQTQMERQQVASSSLSSSAVRTVSSPPSAPPPPSLNGPSPHYPHHSPNVSSHPINVLPGSSSYPVHHRNPSLPLNVVQQLQPPFPSMAPPPPPQQQPSVDLDDLWTETFMSSDPNALPAMIGRISPQALDQMLPPDHSPAVSPLSQTVIMTLVHKFTDLLSKTNIQSSLFPTALLFIQRASRLLDPRDPVVAPYVGRVISVVISTLSKIEEATVRSAGTGGIGERERENVVRILRAVIGELAAKR